MGARAGAGQPDVGHLDAEVIHQMQDFNFVADGRIVNRRGLQPVAERLVIQVDRFAGEAAGTTGRIPVVNERVPVRYYLALLNTYGLSST